MQFLNVHHVKEFHIPNLLSSTHVAYKMTYNLGPLVWLIIKGISWVVDQWKRYYLVIHKLKTTIVQKS